MGDVATLVEQRQAIQESLVEAIVEGDTAAVRFFRGLLTDLEETMNIIKMHLQL